MKQLHGEIPNFKHELLSLESTKEDNMRNKRTVKLSTQTFSQKQAKSHQNFSTICCLPVEKLNVLLKACVCYFLSIFFFTKWYPFKNYEKCFLFHLKSPFPSRDIQFFVYSFPPPFFSVSHCFRSWFKKNLKVCDVINCLDKNLNYTRT